MRLLAMDEVLSSLSETQSSRLRHARVGIAGAGGLGSNVAMMLARSGVGTLLVIDGDRVEPSNLNRQHYFPVHVGRLKVEALAEQLLALNPGMNVETHAVWLDRTNIAPLLAGAELWIEALDGPETKALFATCALSAAKPVICASGMGGVGGFAMKRRLMGGMTVVGDFRSDVAELPPLAPRVMQCAAMQADAALEWLLTGTMKELL